MTPREANELQRRIEAILAAHGMDFGSAESMIRSVIRSKARTMPEDDVRDRTQEVWLALCRLERAGIELKDAKAWLGTVAARQAFQWLRRQRSWQMIDPADPQEVSDLMDQLPANDDRVEASRMLFVIREFFYTVSPGCMRIFDLLNIGLPHRVVADQLGLGHDAERQQWSRCMGFVRQTFVADGGALAAWMRQVA